MSPHRHPSGDASEQAYGQGMTVAALEAQALHGILQVCLFASAHA
jgi:hypothetical protein